MKTQSALAALAAIAQKLADISPDTRIPGFNYATGERYLSVQDFLPEV
jgi:cysteine synthase A